MNTTPQLFDLIIIGGGPGGYTTAAEAAASGLSVALIEKDNLGGTCLNQGCIPTKSLCHSAAEASPLAEAMEMKVKVVETLRKGIASLLAKVTLFKGEAEMEPDHCVRVDGELLFAPKIIIATGSYAATLPIPGADLAFTSTEMLSLTNLPRSLAIIGGGVIGMEFASMMCDWGVEVTVIEYCPEILPPFDRDIAKRLRMILKRRGVNIITAAGVTAISKDEDEKFSVTYSTKGKEKSVTADLVLMAVGRRALLPKGLDKAGVTTDKRGFIITDNDMLTSAPGIYAIGDVNGRCLLAHAAEAQGRKVIGLPVNLDVIPAVAFTNPPCATVGMTQTECEASGFTPLVGSSTFHSNGYAVATGKTDGMVKLLFHPDTKKLLGCSMVGAGADLMIASLAMALNLGATLGDMQSMVFAHPTLGETISAAARNAK